MRSLSFEMGVQYLILKHKKNKKWNKFLITAGSRVQGTTDEILVIDKGLVTPSDKVRVSEGKRERKAGGSCVHCTLKGQCWAAGVHEVLTVQTNLTAASCSPARHRRPGAGPPHTIATFTLRA